jgi:hypothetical protein
MALVGSYHLWLHPLSFHKLHLHSDGRKGPTIIVQVWRHRLIGGLSSAFNGGVRIDTTAADSNPFRHWRSQGPVGLLGIRSSKLPHDSKPDRGPRWGHKCASGEIGSTATYVRIISAKEYLKARNAMHVLVHRTFISSDD